MNDSIDTSAITDILTDHLKGVFRESKKAGISRISILKCYLKAVIHYTKDLKTIKTDDDFLKFHSANVTVPYEGDMVADYRALDGQNEDRNFFLNIMIKYFDKLVIEEGVKMGLPEEALSEIIIAKNKETTQKLADHFLVESKKKDNLPDNEQEQKQYNPDPSENEVSEDVPQPELELREEEEQKQEEHHLPEDMIIEDGSTPDKPMEEEAQNEGHHLPEDMIDMFEENNEPEYEQEITNSMNM